MDKFKELSDEQVVALAAEKREALQPMLALETPTPAQVQEAQALAAEMREAEAEIKEREEAAAKAAADFAALKDSFAEADDKDAEPEEPEGAEPEEPAEPEVEAAAEPEPVEPAEPVTEPEPVKASAVKTLAAKTSRPAAPQVKRSGGPVTIVAAAGLDDFAPGSRMDDLLSVAEASISVAKSFPVPDGNGGEPVLRRFGTASFHIEFPEDLLVDERDSAERISAAMDHAADERRLPGGSLAESTVAARNSSLTAAGGWCAPSETVYDLDDDATTEGMLSLPEIGVRRGGIRWAVSPTFADFYANPGFVQTEAQAIAGTTKPCVEVDCPSFDEERLDAEGLCIKVPILTNAGYPEYVRTFVSGTLTAHQHWINANVIGRLVTAAGAARVFTGLGGTVSDAMESIGLIADQTRQKYRLSINASVEVVVPFWVRTMMLNDIERRMGYSQTGAAALIDAYFAERKAAVQYVYDWQMIDETAEVYPATFNILVYPAGTFVKGTAPVINLQTVYDAASLAENTYTGLFTEQGLLVAHKKFHADLATLPICNAGRTGINDLTCVVGP